MTYDAWVNFRATTKDGTLLIHACDFERSAPVFEGWTLMVGDHDGNAAEATIISVDWPYVTVRLDKGTFRSIA